MNHAQTFQNLAIKFRKLAELASESATAEHLRELAAEYEGQAYRAAPAAQSAEELRVEPILMSDRACFRYKTHVLVGPWRRRAERALQDAIAAGQVRRAGAGDFQWIVAGEIEESPCRRDAPCGGVYPSD